MSRNNEIKQKKDFFYICKECGKECCKDAKPPISVKRKKIIEEYIKEKKLEIVNPFKKDVYTYPKKVINGFCVFLDQMSGKCIIQSVKPETCVAGPVTFDINLKSKKTEWYLKKEEICLLAGVVFKNKEFLLQHLYNAKKNVLKLIDALDRKELKKILEIDEPETFKIDVDCISQRILDKIKD